MLKFTLLAILLASPASSATVKEFGSGAKGPTTVALFEKKGPNDLVGTIEHWNAVNSGIGFVRTFTFSLAGFGEIEIELDTTTNSASGSPDSIRLISLPSMLRASSMFEESDESSLGTIDLFYAEPSVTTPVPLPAAFWLILAGIGSLVPFRGRAKS